MNALETTGDDAIRIAFLGAWQHHRDCSWKDAVSAHTTHVMTSRAGRAGRRVLQRLLSEGRDVSEIRIAGYSWGAWTALHLVDLLVRAPRRVHARLATDDFAVRLALLDPVSVFRRKVALPDDPRVQCWNVYQRNGCYRGCPGNSDWYRGQRIEGAKNLDVTNEGRSLTDTDGVPPDLAPDHIQLGYRSWNGWDKRVASVLAGDEPF